MGITKPLGCAVLVLLVQFLRGVHSGGMASAISTDGMRFVDAEGRTVILRGFNVAGDAKLPDYRPLKNLTTLNDLRRFGVNVVRSLFIWEAYEGVRGVYDASYLEYHLGVVDHLARLGIHTILDIHQDAFSRYTLGGCGDGFPLWAIPARFSPAAPDNSLQNCSRWGPRLVTDQPTRRVFEAFYNNEGGVRDSYLALVEHLAGVFRTRPSVIGFDLLNEPVGDEVRHVAPLYTDAAARVRGANSSALILATPGFLVGSGFVPTRLRPPPVDHAVFSPHFYNFVNLAGGYDFGVYTRSVLRRLLAVSRSWGEPLFLGEFGVFHGRFADLFAADMYRFLDDNFLSGCQWSYTTNWSPDKKDGWNGEDLSVVAGGVTRGFPFTPSPRVLAGTPLVARTVPHVSYELSWRSNGAPRTRAAEIYFPLNEFCGSNGFATIEASPSLECGYQDAYSLLCNQTAVAEGTLSVRVNC
ncbi:endoglycoceramidase [Klebsormidium nitens]|uniref:Endoglycoceramidase n=1 Tax=Klebsormidium nitens TaxID=105231 RepID=A0A1Y1IIH1_KLENI|nr:endoglycoceramidase [Klebsormidium nitens]|eukprot:GAQ88881.1 endoglycoceramidase [Klebsormidium nitens]